MARATKKRTKVKRDSPSPEEVEASLRKYDQKFLACREMHPWVIVGFYYDAEGDIRRMWKCQRCETVKRNRMAPNGTFVGSTTYVHPSGYKMLAVQRVQVRAESIRRAKVYSSEKTMLAKSITLPVRHQRKKVSA